MKNYTLISILACTLSIMAGACSDDDIITPLPVQGEDQIQESTFSETFGLRTNKARYNPGEGVEFNIDEVPSSTIVRYISEGTILSEETLSAKTWDWMPPSEDFKGYMVELVNNQDGSEKILGTIGVDVSSDWTRFPRYGFLSEFGEITNQHQDEVMENLKNFHINGIQYYDWHHTSQTPLPLTEAGDPKASWQDLFDRNIYLQTVQYYITKGHEKNMASMFYDLLFGAGEGYIEDGVSRKWLFYKDRLHNNIDSHGLGDFGDINLVDASNENWQSFIFGKTRSVYENLDFDGWHLDQLGDRGLVYDYEGYELNLPKSFNNFLTNLNNEFPDKKMALNAVDQFGQSEILETPVDFSYSEVWTRNQYKDLVDVIKENNEYSNGRLNSVLAAYMNYESQEGQFNTPSVLLVDAVIFAFGGDHLELGEHMLSSEYFPNDKLSMDNDLKASLTEYYDFLTAYQNLLRDGGNFNVPEISSQNESILQLNQWPPVYGKAAVVGKRFEKKQVVHLLNFNGISTMQWRDNEKVQTRPTIKADFDVVLQSDSPVSKVWFASPDYQGGAHKTLEFSQNDGQVAFTVPYLEYWDMLVVEYQ